MQFSKNLQLMYEHKKDVSVLFVTLYRYKTINTVNNSS